MHSQSQLDLLNVWEKPVFENFITSENILSIPCTSPSFGSNDEIRLISANRGLIYLPQKSYIYLKLKYTKKSNAKELNLAFKPNFFLHLFSHIRLEINGQILDEVRNPGMIGTIRHFLMNRKSTAESLALSEYGAFHDTERAQSFDIIIPLRVLLGVAESYNHPIIFSTIQLTLVRASNDSNAVTIPPNQGVTFELDHCSWELPVIQVVPAVLQKFEKLAKDKTELFIPFKNYTLFSYPDLPGTTDLTWNVRSFLSRERPRYIICCFQNAEKNLTHANVISIKAIINNTFFPCNSVAQTNFALNHFSIIYENYRRFHEEYYKDLKSEPMLSAQQFLQNPLFVIDTSKQNENDLTKTVDLMIQIKTSEAFAAGTTLHALAISDKVLAYSPGLGYLSNTALA